MSLRVFLNCCYAIQVDDFCRLGLDTLTAVQRVDGWLGIAAPEPQAAVEAGNMDALAELNRMVSG